MNELKLKANDVLYINTEDYFGVKGYKKYKVIEIKKDRKGNLNYIITHNRKNATTKQSLYCTNVDKDIFTENVNTDNPYELLFKGGHEIYKM